MIDEFDENPKNPKKVTPMRPGKPPKYDNSTIIGHVRSMLAMKTKADSIGSNKMNETERATYRYFLTKLRPLVEK